MFTISKKFPTVKDIIYPKLTFALAYSLSFINYNHIIKNEKNKIRLTLFTIVDQRTCLNWQDLVRFRSIQSKEFVFFLCFAQTLTKSIQLRILRQT